MKCRFENLDPLIGEMPPGIALQFFDVVHRSRALLKHRTREEIVVAAEVLNTLPRHPNYRNQDLDDLGSPPTPLRLPNGELANCWPAATEVSQLAYNIDKLNLKDFPQINQAKWFELFAVLALLLADRAVGEDRRRDAPHPLDGIPVPREVTDQAIEELAALGRQALATAQGLHSQVKLLGQRATKAHSKLQPLKREILALAAKESSKRSVRNIAMRIFKALEASGRLEHDTQTNELRFDGIAVTANDDPEHLFEKWIGADRKGPITPK